MKTGHISTGIFAALLLALLPQVTLGYFTTGQTATKLSNTASLFTIEYAFGLEKNDIYMPIIAERGLAWESEAKKVGYTLRENGEDIMTNGKATGIVLSSAPIVNGMYKLEKGNAHKMTLLVILTTSSTESESDYALQVDKLPFYVDKGDQGLQTLQLNPSELQYYVTKEVELNTGNFD